jgi:NodT family efflux transporter outer membrane factor (OMF) lipoprotein
MSGKLVAAACLVTLSACAVGPDFHRPAAPGVAGYLPGPLPGKTAAAAGEAGEAQTFSLGADVPGQWWTLYKSPALNALVDQALKANPDLASAQAALRAAREAYLAQKGALWPTVGASYNATRQKTSDTLAPVLNSNQDLYSLHTAQVTVDYTPDVFGGIRRQTQSVRAQARSQRFQTEATYLTLTTNVVAAAIQEASLREQIEATEDSVAETREVLAVMRRQLALGEIARPDVAAQETALAQAELTLPPLEKQLAQQDDMLADLTGRFPSEAGAPRPDLASLSLPRSLPVSLPSKLVEQRPDVRAAEANLDAASAQVGVAIANRLPNITLEAIAGGQATNIGQLFSNGNDLWSLAGAVAQPIFDGGMLLHKQREARAGYDQATAQYHSTVLSAFQNVADSLQALLADARQLAAAQTADETAAESIAIARKQLALGQVSGLILLNAEQAWQQARIARAQAAAARLADSAALFQSLGGGWRNRTEPADIK